MAHFLPALPYSQACNNLPYHTKMSGRIPAQRLLLQSCFHISHAKVCPLRIRRQIFSGLRHLLFFLPQCLYMAFRKTCRRQFSLYFHLQIQENTFAYKVCSVQRSTTGQSLPKIPCTPYSVHTACLNAFFH